MKPSTPTLFLLSLTFISCGSSDPDATKPTEPQEKREYTTVVEPLSSHIDLWMGDDGMPIADYEGIGEKKSRSASDTEVDLIAHLLPPGVSYESDELNDEPKFHVVELSANYDLGDNDTVSIEGTLHVKHPVSVRFNWMVEDGDDSDNENPMRAYEAGQHKIAFRGKVTGWAESPWKRFK